MGWEFKRKHSSHSTSLGFAHGYIPTWVSEESKAEGSLQALV